MITPKKISLAQIPTPLEELKFESKSFLLKRDDLTGCELSGNKVRKLSNKKNQFFLLTTPSPLIVHINRHFWTWFSGDT